MTHGRFGPNEYLRRRNLPPRERVKYLVPQRHALDDQSVDDIVRDLVGRRDEDDPPDCISLRGDE